MQSEMRRKYQRRTAEAWRELLNEQAVSGLTIGVKQRAKVSSIWVETASKLTT